MDDLTKAVEALKGVKILVAGDLMLDRFIMGDAERISPEAPVPVLTIREENVMLGGAGNVVSNLAALGAQTFVFALVGNDHAAAQVGDILSSLGSDQSGVIKDSTRPTTIKTRYLASHQQLLRSDFEKTHAMPQALQEDMLERMEKIMADVQAVVLSDYGKGALPDALIAKIIALASQYGVPVLVDPKGKNYAKYAGALLVTPNRKELAEAAGSGPLKSDEEIAAAAQKIIRGCGIGNVIATRSEDGLSVISKDAPAIHIATQAREVFDVSGAGDTVISVLAAALAGGASLAEAAHLANIAGGIAVSKVGTAPVHFEELLNAAQSHGGDDALIAPLLDLAKGDEQVRKWKAQGLKVGFTNGCFDIVHKGHVKYLAQARSQCDRLIVALNKDVSVRLLKGPTRPVNDEVARASVIGALGSVDLVMLFGAEEKGQDNTPSSLIVALKPDLFFKGGDYTEDQLPEAAIVRSYGGEVRLMGQEQGYSTTAIIRKASS